MIQYLYKYRSDDIYTIKLLCEQRLHFSHPADFNDPFDCKPFCIRNVKDEDLIAQLKTSCPWLLELSNNSVESFRKMGQDGHIQEKISEALNWNYVCCFSYNADIPTMWAHYANNHTGLCLGFDMTIEGAYLEGIRGVVNYTKKQTPFDWTQLGRGPINTKNFFFEKSEEWAYEQEYRIVKHHSQIEHTKEFDNSFTKDALVAMFFGLKMPQERQNFYINLCKMCGLNNVVFYKMTMPTDGTYHLKPVEIKSDKDSDA